MYRPGRAALALVASQAFFNGALAVEVLWLGRWLERETLGEEELKLLMADRELPPLPEPPAETPEPSAGKPDEREKEADAPFGERSIPDPEPMPG